MRGLEDAQGGGTRLGLQPASTGWRRFARVGSCADALDPQSQRQAGEAEMASVRPVPPNSYLPASFQCFPPTHSTTSRKDDGPSTRWILALCRSTPLS